MSAVIVLNTAPAQIEVATADFIDRFDAMIMASASTPITTDDQKLAAEGICRSLRALGKEIEATRKQGTSALDAIISAAIACERQYTGTIDKCWSDLTKRIQAYIDAENAKRAEAARIAREEQAALQKIEDDRAAAEQARIQKEIDDATPPGDEPAAAPVEAVRPVMVPERYVAPPLKSMATKKQTNFVLEYIDRKKVPAFSASGHELREINETTLKAFLKSLPEGEREIAGAVRLVTTTGVAAR